MKHFLFLILLILLVSCKKEKKVKTESETKTLSSVFTKINVPTSGFSHLPRLSSNNGSLHLSWMEMKDSVATLKYAKYTKSSWNDSEIVSSGKDWFVNWADFPALAVNGEHVLINTLQKSTSGTYDYDIKLHLFSSKTKKENFLLHTDGVSAEHGFVSMHVYDGGYYISWLDGRNTKNKDAEKNQMTLRNAFIDTEGKISEEVEIDERVCDCCSTATAISNNGPIVVYRDRSNGKQEIRDISIVRWVDGKWTAPKPVHEDNWKLNGCPVNGSAIDTKESNVVVAWFTAENETPRIMMAFSDNNGENFKNPVRIDGGNAIGRVDVNFLKDNSALISWLEPKGEDVVLQVARVYKDGHKDENITIVNTSAERQSGFPQLEVIGDTVYVAWTDLKKEKPTVKMISYTISE